MQRPLGVVVMGMHYRQLTLVERSKIETYLKEGKSIRYIARELHRAPSTIMRELRRHDITQFAERRGYFSSYECVSAQRQAGVSASKKGAPLKIGRDAATALHLERRLRQGYSPYAAIERVRRDGQLGTEITSRTLYNYIHRHVLGVGTEVLVLGSRKKKSRGHEDFNKRKIARNTVDYPSIEERPKSVLSREEFGHWEADTVVGKKKTKSVLLTMVERKTRYAIAVKLPNRRRDTIVKGFDHVEQMVGPEVFSEIFKTITFDNGVEFLDVQGIKRSYRSSGAHANERVHSVFFCHPFCSSERGSNEVMHTFIRRRWPKGTDFEGVSSEDVSKHMDWINDYPRKLHGGRSAKELFYEELRQLA